MSNVEGKKLGDILNLKRGYDLPSYEREDGLYPIFSSSGISGYHSQYKADGEGVVIGRYGTLGEPYYVNGKYWPHNTSLYVTDFKGNSPKYVYYLLKCLGDIKTSDKSTVPGVNRNELHEMSVPFVTIREQQNKIAAVLSALDAKIELNNRINAELESLAKTIYDYWFVQFDFPFDFAQGKPSADGKPYKSSGGEMVYVQEGKSDRAIPAGWEFGRVSDLFEINPSETLSKGNISAYIDMSAIPTSGFMTGEIQYKPFNGGMKFRNGDVVIARITPCLENGKTGLITLLKDDEIGFGSTEFIVLREKNRSLSSFAACLSRSTSFRNFAISNMTGTSGRKRVDAKAIERFSIPVPEDGLISQFEDVVSRYFQLLTINTRENQQLTQLRDWLLPMLMNGQVSIK